MWHFDVHEGGGEGGGAKEIVPLHSGSKLVQILFFARENGRRRRFRAMIR